MAAIMAAATLPAARVPALGLASHGVGAQRD